MLRKERKTEICKENFLHQNASWMVSCVLPVCQVCKNIEIWAQRLSFATSGQELFFDYCKVPKFSDARKLCCILPKIHTKSPNLKVFCQTDANGIANSEYTDQTVPAGPICPKTLDQYSIQVH